MKLLFLIGNGAVGKMTVGQELTKITDLRLFHNHMTIEPVLEVFGTLNRAAVDGLRRVIFEEFAKSDNYGLIFTYMWAFDQQEDWNYVNSVMDIFRPYGTEFYCAELIAPQDVRLRRNGTENRLKNKASKRDLEVSNGRILAADEMYRMESFPGELPFANYIKIDNSDLTPQEAAKQIKDAFAL